MKYGRYEIKKELGKGAMGVVYQAHDPEIDRRVALKVLRPDRVTSEDFLQRFLKEAKAIGRLSHPHIVTVYDVGRDHGTVYIAMEFLEGCPLDESLKEAPPDLKAIVNIGVQVAQTLDYAHGQGIVHRDIKPSNIMITPEGNVKITDFGIARIEDPASPQLTHAGEILGTPVYMSPEQVKGQAVDGRSDLYSLGVILYEISTGKRPFTGKNLAAIFNAITSETPKAPLAAEPFIARCASPSLSVLILKCLDKTPEYRFQTGKSMAEALSACLGADAESLPEKTPSPPKTTKAGVYAAIAACITVVAMGIVWFQFSRKPATPSPAPIQQPIHGAVVSKPDPAKKPVVEPTEEVRLPEKTPVSLSAALNVTSNPAGARVYLDGSFKGSTPMKLDLTMGKYEVRVTHPEHYEWEAQIQLKEAGETPLYVRLIPKE